ncbi:zf-HC2 domain-containing protein [Brevibacillus sp. H7]|uniref:zf-HC2 domain-containing protein n=1 Tax=Brevibacillus sp. H7 TaxID=3349138 RepID=UPI0038268451
MRCEEVQEYIPDYADKLLPEVTSRRIDNHLASCKSCRSEYVVWAESGNWIQAEKEQYASVSTARSIVDAVMNRILSEEKWAIPFGKKVFTLTARMRRFSLSAAAVLLLLCGFSLYNNTHSPQETNALLVGGEVVSMNVEKAPQVISSSIQSDDGTYIVESEPVSAESEPTSKSSPSVLPIDGETTEGEPAKPKYSLILSFFGILVTVLAMSWLTRV